MSKKRSPIKKYKYDFAKQSNAQRANMAIKMAGDIRCVSEHSQLCHFLDEVAKRLAA